MKWICLCYGSTEACSFPAPIITLPSFDKEPWVLESIETISIVNLIAALASGHL